MTRTVYISNFQPIASKVSIEGLVPTTVEHRLKKTRRNLARVGFQEELAGIGSKEASRRLRAADITQVTSTLKDRLECGDYRSNRRNAKFLQFKTASLRWATRNYF